MLRHRPGRQTVPEEALNELLSAFAAWMLYSRYDPLFDNVIGDLTTYTVCAYHRGDLSFFRLLWPGDKDLKGGEYRRARLWAELLAARLFANRAGPRSEPAIAENIYVVARSTLHQERRGDGARTRCVRYC
jgi:hypothetical protein